MCSKKVTFNSNSLSKSNKDCITELEKMKLIIINNFINVTFNIKYLVSKFDELKVIRQGVVNIFIINKNKHKWILSPISIQSNGKERYG